MFSFSPTDMQSSEGIYGLVAFFILNVIVNLFLVNKYLEEKRKNRILKRSTPSVESSIAKFLTSQFSNTKSHNRMLANAENQLHKEVVHLRSAYLKIEEKAITREIDSPQYWRYLDDNLLKLFKIIFPHANSKNNEAAELERKIALLKERITNIPSSADNKSVEQHKARAIASLESISAQQSAKGYDRANLRKQLDKFESVVDIFENPDARKAYLLKKKRTRFTDNSGRHMKQLERLSRDSTAGMASFADSLEAPNAFADEISHFQRENEALAEQITQLKSELSSFKGRTLEAHSSGSFYQDSERGVDARDLTDITDELIENNEKEIDRLRDVIANQRHSILEMEKSLNTLEQLTPHESGDHHSEIGKLKRCIQESEVCISMLEQELDELKNDLAELKNSTPNGDLSPREAEELNDEVKLLKSEIEKSQHQISAFEQLSNYTDAALSASSVEDVALLVYETIMSLNYSPQLLIKSPERVLELPTQGAVPVREKVVINNMQINEANPGSSGQLNFRFMQIAGIIRPPPEVEPKESDQQLIIKMLKFTDKIITLLTHAQKSKRYGKMRDETINSIKHISYDLDKMIEEHGIRSKVVVSRSFQQISDIARAKGMTATQVAAIHSIEQDTVKQIETANALRLKSRKNFLTLIKAIEDAKW